MTATKRDPLLVVVQLTGGNDYMNTVIPYGDPLYQDNRPTVGIPVGQVLPIDDHLGFNPAMQPIKDLYDQDKVAVINGIGYPNPNRSHFRAMDIWHTCEPDKIANEGWLGRVIRDLDPNAENVLTGVNFGRGLPRAMALSGVPVASVAVLENYGVLTGIADPQQRTGALELFARMYAPVSGTGPVMDYLGRTGLDALKGADVLKTAPSLYQSTVEYADSPIGQNLQGIAKVLLAGLGTRIFYTQQAGYDTHASQTTVQPKLLGELAQGIRDFCADLREHEASDNVLIFVFTEFGRRVKDNGSGTDHGSGGMAMAIGDPVNGGLHGEFPSMKQEDLLEGDLRFNVDFRGVYSTMVERWLGLDPVSIVGGNFEQLDFL
ncbi:MAG: DUF1501 domain-containing protein [Chloroflexi bacterium]|nr:DUF1501 domain-containing protein [Chloroflexota bacterium]MCI0793078.1 DUF1501 domain-containing protein [Chloroflexota bacterium]MCI0859153.1 DUF1501 domain-containing protein [Chloroflexota bacterium]MCI0877952.1 DUF1501 domain-containing protein [Chloroflexota bacterium]